MSFCGVTDAPRNGHQSEPGSLPQSQLGFTARLMMFLIPVFVSPLFMLLFSFCTCLNSSGFKADQS